MLHVLIQLEPGRSCAFQAHEVVLANTSLSCVPQKYLSCVFDKEINRRRNQGLGGVMFLLWAVTTIYKELWGFKESFCFDSQWNNPEFFFYGKCILSRLWLTFKGSETPPTVNWKCIMNTQLKRSTEVLPDNTLGKPSHWACVTTCTQYHTYVLAKPTSSVSHKHTQTVSKAPGVLRGLVLMFS